MAFRFSSTSFYHIYFGIRSLSGVQHFTGQQRTESFLFTKGRHIQLAALFFTSTARCAESKTWSSLIGSIAAVETEGRVSLGAATDDASAAELLANLPPDEQKLLKVLRLEYEVLMSTGLTVPETVADEDWIKIMQLKQLGERRQYYKYLYTTEINKNLRRERSKVKQKAKQLLRKAKLAELEEQCADGTDRFRNRILHHISKTTANRWYENNLCYAVMNGPRLVFDFSFEEQMNDQMLRSSLKQVQMSYGANIKDREPFHFHFCNFKASSKTAENLRDFLPETEKLLISTTTEDYMSCYDKSQLVYLSSNSREILTSLHPDDVYILGVVGDQADEIPTTFAKAKKENLRSARLPIDEHVSWVQGTKSLPLNIVVSILLHFKRTKNWTQALRTHLPYKATNIS